jgi:nucleoside-diphosphate-sugar epimerase
LGRAIIQELEVCGHEVLILSRTRKVGIQSRQIIGDIFNFQDFEKTLSWKPQVVVHTAWITEHALYTESPSNIRYAKFTSHLAIRLARTEVEHLIVLGSCAEYGSQFSHSVAGITSVNPENF